jgi:hypothetical protein
MALPRSEWLRLAQALPIGQSRRTYHNDEHRANLVVGNDLDKWWSYCHRCHDGGVVEKEHVQHGVEVQQQERVMPWPADARPLGTDAALSLQVTRMLLGKGIDVRTMLRGVPLYVSTCTSRLLVGTSGGWLGRALGNVQPKWVAYHGVRGPAVYAMHPEDTLGPRVVLTEDFFSAIKMRWAAPEYGTYCTCLGTSLHNKLVKQLLTTDEVVIAFDGDSAGHHGSAAVAKRIRGLGKPVRILNTPDGYDPKDLSAQQIQELLCPPTSIPLTTPP